MKSTIKIFATAITAFACTIATASEYPSRAIKLVVGFPPGQATDLIARKLSHRLGAAMGQPVIVDNRPGAGAGLAAEMVARSDPDGYTILVTSSGPLAVNPWIYKNLRYDPIQDFKPLAAIGIFPLMLVTNVNSRWNTLADLVTYAKQNADKINYASGGNGVTNHLVMEMFKHAAGVKMLHVPYRGASPAMSDLIGGQVEVMFETVAAAEPLVKQGRLRGIAVASEKRYPSLLQIPTIAESGYPGFRGDAWIGVIAPQKTPQPIVNRLSAEIGKIIRTPEWRKEMAESGALPLDMSPIQFGEFIKSEISHWGEAAKRANVQPQ